MVIHANAQNLPGSWSISADGRTLTAGGENHDGFYNQDQIHDIQLEFPQPNWWALLENNYNSGTDIMATCWIDSVQMEWNGTISSKKIIKI